MFVHEKLIIPKLSCIVIEVAWVTITLLGLIFSEMADKQLFKTIQACMLFAATLANIWLGYVEYIIKKQGSSTNKVKPYDPSLDSYFEILTQPHNSERHV